MKKYKNYKMSTPDKIESDDPLLYNEIIEEDLERFDNTDIRNKTEYLPKCLEFHSSFPHSGKQGVVGLLVDRDNGRKYIYKISQYLNFIVDQEYEVMSGLNFLREYCPHFCKALGRYEAKINDKYRTIDNPFEYDRKRDGVIKANVLLMEYIDGGRKLYRYIKNENIAPEIVMSLIKQTLIATLIAGEHLRFTHYDLHSNNVLVKKCQPNSAFFYILDENRTYLTPTYGYIPTIIDFGFSFDRNCENKPFYGSLAHTNVGFVPSVYDQYADSKLFLCSVSTEFKKYKKCDTSIAFRQLVKNIYHNCNVDLECGWDTFENGESQSISDQLLRQMSSAFKRSEFFKNQGHHIVDILQSLVELPFTSRQTNDRIDEMAAIFVSEFSKIEKYIQDDFDNMYILKQMITACCKYGMMYKNPESRQQSVNFFKEVVLESIDSVVSYCNVKFDWERLLCSLLCLSKCIENYCYGKLRKLMSVKKSDYNMIPLRSPTEIYEAVEANFPSHFQYDDETVVYVWDCVERKNYKIKLSPSLITTLNKTHPFERGMVLYEYISSN
jgi:hypothetical protein